MREMILFHKTPAKWNKSGVFGTNDRVSGPPSHLPEHSVTAGINTLVSDDIYIQLCDRLRKECGFDRLHVVQGFRAEEEKNWFVEEQQGRFVVSETLTYWCLTEPEQLMALPTAEIVFSRGNYQRLHRELFEHANGLNEAFWIHYPATAAFFPHLDAYETYVMNSLKRKTNDVRSIKQQSIGMNVEHQITATDGDTDQDFVDSLAAKIGKFREVRTRINNGPYDLVLVDDVPSMDFYQSVYPNSQILNFLKPCLSPQGAVRHDRKHDLMFCGTTLQPTKNHMQFLELLNDLDLTATSPISVAVVGNQGNMTSFSDRLRTTYVHLQVVDYGEVNRERLYELFNDTRAVIVLSGRDCNPRIIQEAGVAGARVIASDTLSDGRDVLSKNPILGSVVPTERSNWFFQKNGNLIFDVNRSFTLEVIEQLARSTHPMLTSSLARSKYSFDPTVEKIKSAFNLLN